MYLLLKMVVFHCYVSSREGICQRYLGFQIIELGLPRSSAGRMVTPQSTGWNGQKNTTFYRSFGLQWRWHDKHDIEKLTIYIYIYTPTVFLGVVKFSFLGIVKNDFCSTTHCGLRRTSSSIFFIAAVATSYQSDTVGGRNPAAVDMVKIEYPLFTRFYTSQVVQDFFHQQYQVQSLRPCFLFFVFMIKHWKTWNPGW